MANYKKDMWNWLIAYGGVVVPEARFVDHNKGGYWPSDFVDYYGSKLCMSRGKTIDVLDHIRAISIDYEASTDPANHVGHGFKHTYTDSALDFHFLLGELSLVDGTKYYWGSHTDDIGFTGVVRVLNSPMELDKALDKLEQRLRDPNTDDFSFAYKARLPRVRAVSFVVEEE